MEGTIKIEAIPEKGVAVEMDVRNASRFDMMGVFDALATGFKLDSADRMVFGVMLAFGNLKTTSIEMDTEMLKLLKKMKEKNDETDAH